MKISGRQRQLWTNEYSLADKYDLLLRFSNEKDALKVSSPLSISPSVFSLFFPSLSPSLPLYSVSSISDILPIFLLIR
jgi:hypothetical protein